MALKNIIVIGASAGGVTALRDVVRGLPPDFDASVFIVLHISRDVPSLLAEILQRETTLTVRQATDDAPIRPRHIYVAPPDHHLIVDVERMSLTRGPRENRARPAVDVLFRSAANAHRRGVVGVVLTGALDDGTAGMWAVKFRGGTTVVQDPREAVCPSMPQSVLRYVSVDHVVSLSEVAPLLVRLASEPVTMSAEGALTSRPLDVEDQIARGDRAFELSVLGLGPVSPYTCPECHGVLVQIKEGGVPRFRCHTGHAYTLQNLFAEVNEAVEVSLWNTLRTLDESVMLLDHLAQHARDQGVPADAVERFTRRAQDVLRMTETLRQITQNPILQNVESEDPPLG